MPAVPPPAREPYAQRRARLLEGRHNAVAVVAASPERLRSGDSHYPYRASSDLLYLCGFPEPEALLVIEGSPVDRTTLFCRPRDAAREIWDGLRFGPEGAREVFGVDEAYPLDAIDAQLPTLLRAKDELWYALGALPALDQRLLSMLETLRGGRRTPDQAPGVLVDPRPRLHSLRARKDADEIRLMREAAALTLGGHLEAMRVTAPGLHEYEVQAALERTFRAGGAAGPAYSSIVAGGENACILHYTENRSVLQEGELLLIDAGAEVHGYAGDITTTFPVGERFTGPQGTLYEAVLAAERFAISLVRPGISQHEIHEATCRHLSQSLLDIGLLEGSLDDVIESAAYKRFFMHGTGHYLGLDVHDVGPYYVAPSQPVPLEPGMVITIEPGLYVSRRDPESPEGFAGTGIRIEDDVLVTEEGHEVLTTGLPRDREEIEAFRRDARGPRA